MSPILSKSSAIRHFEHGMRKTRGGTTFVFYMKLLHYYSPWSVSLFYYPPFSSRTYLSSPSLFQHPVNMEGDLLTLPCGQETGQVDYGDLLDEEDPNFIPVNQPPTIPPRVRVASSFCTYVWWVLLSNQIFELEYQHKVEWTQQTSWF